MKSVYKLVANKVVEFEGDKEVHTYKDCNEIFNRDFKLADSLAHEYENGADDFSHMINSSQLKKDIAAFVCKHFLAMFKANEGVLTASAYEEEAENLEEKFSKMGSDLYRNAKKMLDENIQNLLGNNKVTGGNMFKTTKEAKTFTAHLDALANEIEGLDGVSTDMKKHLAYRLDRLSDLIEVSSYQNEKQASTKEANGVGSGTWAQDSDEKYMNTFGGTGTLMGDADEVKYMKEFKGDDHKEVLERKEPSEIAGAGAKKKQPSDNYNENEVAKKLRSTIKSIMAEIK